MIENQLNQPEIGMSWKNPSMLKETEFSLLNNGSILSYNDTSFQITNEPSNILSSRLKGFKVLNTNLVPALGLTFYFLVNPQTGESEIGYTYDQSNLDSTDRTAYCGECNNPVVEDTPLEQQTPTETTNYYTFVNASCLNFNIDFPIQSWIKIDDCRVRIYFSDGLNPMRYIDYDDFELKLQNKTLLNCPILHSDELDCNKINIFPSTCYPKIDVTDVVSGGQNQAGMYQFALCYSDVNSNKVTDYFHVTNPIPLFTEQITIATDYSVSKSIKLQISNLNTDFQYINLVVLKTINTVTSVFLVETIQTNSSSLSYLYTGIDANIQQNLAIDDVTSRRPIYIAAKGITESNGYLMLYDLQQPRILNLQSEMIDLPIYWQTVSMKEGSYKNPEISGNFVGYLGDEVYGVGISFTRTNAPDTAVFHIAGRKSTPYDWDNMGCIDINGNPAPCVTPPSGATIITNKDVFTENTCSTSIPAFRWQVYNTASLIGNAIGFDENPVTLSVARTCVSPKFQITPSNQFLDLNNIPITDWCNFCANCQTAIIAQYSGIQGITFNNITCDTVAPTGISDSNVSVITPSGVTTIYQYNDNGVTLPPVANFPYPFNPCTTNPSGTTQGFVDVKTNADPNGAYFSPISPTSTCSQDPGFPVAPQYGTFYNNIPSQSNTSKSTTSDINRSWFSFTATSNTIPIAVSVYTDNNPFIEVYDSSILTNPTASSIPDVFLNHPGASYINQSYVVLNPAVLTIGTTYYIKIYGGITIPSPPDTRNCYFRLCLTTPNSTGSTTQNSNAIATIDCKFTVNYTTVLAPNNPCSIPNYQFGRMAYWESTELYPCNTELYGEYAGKPIRHHKFPDETVSPYFSANGANPSNSFNTLNCQIYPKGIMISVKDIKQKLLNAYFKGLITNDELNSICGYRIWRSDRRGNESILGKGLLYDVWSYKDNAFNSGQDILFSNFPYNDNSPNIFINKRKIRNQYDANNLDLLTHPNKDYSNTQYTFDAPNLLFNNPGLGTELKLESELYGISNGSYQDIKNNCVYQYIGPGIISAALGFASIQAGFQALQVLSQATLVIPATVFGSGSGIPLGMILAVIGANLSAPVWLMTYYADWYDVISNFAPFRNYATYYSSVGFYDNNQTTPNTGFKRRTILNTEYLKPGILNVSTSIGNIRFNHYQRESTCFIEVDSPLPKTVHTDASRWKPTDNGGNPWTDASKSTPICSYYASMKNNLPNQYGNLESIRYIDTGFNGIIDWTNETQDTTNQTIFGGDTYINRFANKRKIPMFLDDRVPTATTNITAAQNQDISLSEIPNVGWPVYFMDYPTSLDYTANIYNLFGNVAVKDATRADFNFVNYGSDGNSWANFGLASAVLGALAGFFFGVPSLSIYVSVAVGLVRTNLGSDTFLKGDYFHSFYGIPYFLVESNYNLDYRYGENLTNKDFYPHVSDTVNWTQQTFVPINEDNYYSYNNTYSKANKENFFYILNEDFNQQIEDCKVHNQDRVIYSLQDLDQNDKYDGNLIFLANNYYDFPKSGGKITILKGIENNKVLVVQENQASLFNSYVQLQTNIGTASVGSNNLFSQNPAQYIKTDLGFGGSQTSAFISTEYGHFWVDNKRGQILNLSQSVQDVIKPEDSWWFKQNLPFNILKDFKDVDINNNYKYFGMSLAYDARFKRIFITKRDVQLLPQWKNQVSYANNQFSISTESGTQIILPTDPTYFCNKSWTISYSPLTKTFVSFHSFTPNYYVSNQNYFSSGINFSTTQNDQLEDGVWCHLLTTRSFQVYYGNLYPFILDFSIPSKYQNKIFGSLEYKAEFRRYIDGNNNFYSNPNVTYDRAVIYSSSICSGNVNLVVKQKNNFFQSTQYPKITPQGTETLIENIEGFWRTNAGFIDLSLKNGEPTLVYTCSLPYPVVNSNAISYAPKFISLPLREDYFCIRLINDSKSNYNIYHRFSLETDTTSPE